MTMSKIKIDINIKKEEITTIEIRITTKKANKKAVNKTTNGIQSQ